MLLSQQDESDNPVPTTLQVTDEEYYQWQKDIGAIKLPDRVFELIFTYASSWMRYRTPLRVRSSLEKSDPLTPGQRFL
jgi:hypothetical protein